MLYLNHKLHFWAGELSGATHLEPEPLRSDILTYWPLQLWSLDLWIYVNMDGDVHQVSTCLGPASCLHRCCHASSAVSHAHVACCGIPISLSQTCQLTTVCARVACHKMPYRHATRRCCRHYGTNAASRLHAHLLSCMQYQPSYHCKLEFDDAATRTA